MELIDVDGKSYQIANFSEFGKWQHRLEKCQGKDILIMTTGDRKSIIKFKNMQMFMVTNFRNEQTLVLMERYEDDECQEIHICCTDVERIEVLEWVEEADVEDFCAVFKFKTGNELHMTKCA